MKRAKHNLSMVFAILLGMATIQVNAALTGPIQEEEQVVLFPTTNMINKGRAVAESACADCHGVDGISGGEGIPHLAGQRAVYLYRVQQAMREGTYIDETGNHNTFLNDDAVLSVSAYYASLTPVFIPFSADSKQQAESWEEDSFMGIRDAMAKCVKCHDETGNSEGSGMPSLNAQSPEYFVTSMMAYVDGSRSHRLMKKFVSKLEEALIEEMGVFYAVQTPVRSQTQGEGDVNVGRRLAQDCNNCHGDGGNTEKTNMPTLAGQDSRYFIKAMNHYKSGKRQHQKMIEAVEQLSEQDMVDLATYYAAQEPVKRNIRAPLKSTEWIARCERCHGVDGNSNDPRFPLLAGQDESYLKTSLKAAAASGNGSTAMHKMADRLSSMDVDRIAAYFASRQPKAVIYIQLPCGNDD